MFGQPTPGGFGAPATGGFGAPATGGFGAAAAGGFGQTATSGFGAAPAAGGFGAAAAAQPANPNNDKEVSPAPQDAVSCLRWSPNASQKVQLLSSRDAPFLPLTRHGSGSPCVKNGDMAQFWRVFVIQHLAATTWDGNTICYQVDAQARLCWLSAPAVVNWDN